jgi:hypothetical protein
MRGEEEERRRGVGMHSKGEPTHRRVVGIIKHVTQFQLPHIENVYYCINIHTTRIAYKKDRT